MGKMKYDCKYCGHKCRDKICSHCRSKLTLVRKLLRMVKEAAGVYDGETK